MSLWAVSTFRNEADIAEDSVRAMARQVDGMIIMDNLSDDGTGDILRQSYDVPVIVIDCDEEAFYQGKRMTELSHLAHDEYGADWIVPWEADAILVPVDRTTTLKDMVADLDHDVDVLECIPFRHYGILPPPKINPMRWMGWRTPKDRPRDQTQVMFRYFPNLRVAEGNHMVLPENFPDGDWATGIRHDRTGYTVSGLFETHNFPYRSFEQALKKIRTHGEAINKTTLNYGIGSHWRNRLDMLNESERAFLDEIATFEFTDNPEAMGLEWDAVWE